MTKLIFCFDGTCNDPEDVGDFFEDSSISNVLKLHAFFGGQLNSSNSDNQNPDQRSFYSSGVGTRGSWLKQKFNAMFAPPYGDIEEILKEANENLDKHYRPGDKIYVFGFSRGAAIARMFAANIEPKPIQFLGVFDTVAATRGSLDLNPNTFPSSGVVFENGSIGSHIKKAVHLLSLDERRIAFQPTLFNAEGDSDHGNKITEVWFSGVHSDVGGGYWFDGLSDITLQFMIDQIKNDLNVLPVTEVNYSGLKIKGAQDSICIDDLNVNGLAHGKIHEQKRSGIKAKTLSPRLVRVDKNDTRSILTPVIHHSVVKRFGSVSEYRPYALRDVNYHVLNEDGAINTNGDKGFDGIKGLAQA